MDLYINFYLHFRQILSTDVLSVNMTVVNVIAIALMNHSICLYHCALSPMYVWESLVHLWEFCVETTELNGKV